MEENKFEQIVQKWKESGYLDNIKLAQYFKFNLAQYFECDNVQIINEENTILPVAIRAINNMKKNLNIEAGIKVTSNHERKGSEVQILQSTQFNNYIVLWI